MALIILDQATGEILGNLDEGDRILKKKSLDHLADTITIPKEETFKKMYDQSIRAVIDCKLSGADYAIMLYMASNLRYQSNAVQHPNGRLITRETLTSEMGLNKETVKRAIRSLISQGIIVEVDSTVGKVFVVNPYIFNVGDKISKTMHDLFKGTQWARGWAK